MSEQGLISVLMPAYQCGPFVGRAIESMLFQTYPNIEVVVVDDGSRDDTLREIQRWVNKDARVRAFSITHSGNAVARNIGLKKCLGEFIALQDADDWSDPDRLQRQIAALQQEGADICSCLMMTIQDNGASFVDPCGSGMHPRDFCTDMVWKGPAHATLLYRRSVYERAGGYETSLKGRTVGSCDTGWLFRLLSFDQPAFRWAHVHQALYSYRQHPRQFTRSYGSVRGMEDHLLFAAKYRAAILKRLDREGIHD